MIGLPCSFHPPPPHHNPNPIPNPQGPLDLDRPTLSTPTSTATVKSSLLHQVREWSGWKIGLTAGHTLVPRNDPEALACLRRQLGADLLVHGSDSPAFALDVERRLLSPGPACATRPVPSFAVLNVTPERLVYKIGGREGKTARGRGG